MSSLLKTRHCGCGGQLPHLGHPGNPGHCLPVVCPIEKSVRRWVAASGGRALAVATAQRREHANSPGRGHLEFDGSILAFRKFTSSELLDAGFNVSVVAQRQGHGPQVLTRHYSKSRASSDKRAAEHLGRVVHGKG